MRLFSANVTAALARDDTETIYLVRITDVAGTVLISSTTFFEQVTLSNGYVYAANGTLVAADPPQLSTTVDREQYKLTFADPEFAAGAHAENGLIGKKLDVRLGFIDFTTGLPFTDVADTFIVYKGRIDGTSYKITTNELGEAILQITGTSPMLSLDMQKGVYLSKNEVRQRNPLDSCADQIFEGSGPTTLKWGKL